MREYEDAMLDVQERHARVHGESTIGIRDCSGTSLSVIWICHEVNPTSEYISSIQKGSNMIIRQVYHEIQSYKAMRSARLRRWLSHERS
jgi:hypothetical protein